MNCDKLLLFLENTNHYFFDGIDDCNVFFISPHKLSSSFVIRVVWHLIRKTPNSLFSKIASRMIIKRRFAKSEIDRICSFKYICLFDSAITPDLLVYLCQILKKKVCVFFWNKTNLANINFIKKLLPKDLIFTYSKREAKDYDLSFLQMPYETICNLDRTEKPLFDFYFFGKDKGRLNDICRLFKALDDAGFNCHADIVTNETTIDPVYEQFVSLRHTFCDYSEYVSTILRAKCIIDIKAYDNPNLTIRYLESSFYGIKLLTNNTDIVEEPLYCTANCFLFDLNQIDVKKIKAFMNIPFLPIEEKTLEGYRLSSFITHIINDLSSSSGGMR